MRCVDIGHAPRTDAHRDSAIIVRRPSMRRFRAGEGTGIDAFGNANVAEARVDSAAARG
jgi:hypothetical protein